MKKKQSVCSTLISNIDPKIKHRILGRLISKENLKKFMDKEKKESVKNLVDLRDIKSKSENEVYEILNTMVKNLQFFMYCGPLLININPGPNYIKDYLNLQNWVKETENKNENEWKPHLYSFMYYVYHTLVKEKKDQVVNMLGQIGSGKTFNIIHIIEYFCCMVGPENYQIETFDVIHKSIQLVHIMGSIFRQNNLESTSCGIVFRLGFGEDNNICNFDLDAKILDCTLPFSENGRTYSILHSFVCAANNDLKRNFNIPENEIQLNFFKKFSKNFSKKTKERFKLNDYEIWNRFHNLLKFFDFSKNEVIEIIQIFSFIIQLNELSMTKGTIGKSQGYIISKGKSSNKISKIFNINEDEFINSMGVFKEVNDIKNALISLMKYSYYICFDYILQKIRFKLKNFFNSLFSNNKNNNTNMKFENYNQIKYINFLDFPGEVEDQTLGGLITNLANECINLFAGSSYSNVVEKLIEEKLFLKLFKPLHSFQVVRTLMGEKGLLTYLSNLFTEENYQKLVKDSKKINVYRKCLHFIDKENFKFTINYSHINVTYNYESLYMETKSIIQTYKAYKIFSLSKNNIIKSTYSKIVDPKKDFISYIYTTLLNLFKPINNVSPFVIYCLHSNNSYEIFFGKDNKNVKKNEEDWVIPRNLTQNMLHQSLCIPILYWEWFGYHEWIDIDTFVKEFGDDYEKAENKIRKRKKNKNIFNNNDENPLNDNINNNEYIQDFSIMNNYEKSNYIITGLAVTKDALVGIHNILMKKGTFLKIRKKIDKLNEEKTPTYILSKKNSSNASKKNSKVNTKNNSKVISKKTSKAELNTNYLNNNTNTNNKNISSIEDILNPNVLKNQNLIFRKTSLKTQCQLLVIHDEDDDGFNLNEEIKKNNMNNNLMKLSNNLNPVKPNLTVLNEGNEFNSKSKFNLFKVMDRFNKDVYEEGINNSVILNRSNFSNTVELESYRKKNNIIIPNKKNFNMVSNLFDYNKNTNFNIFDYSKVLPEIITIQCAYRSFLAFKKKLFLKYIMKQIVLIQSIQRGNNTRKKCKRLLKCLKYIILIQRYFRNHLKKVCEKIIILQSFFRTKIAKNKAYRRTERMKYCLENGLEYYDTSDEERIIKKKKTESKNSLYEKNYNNNNNKKVKKKSIPYNTKKRIYNKNYNEDKYDLNKIKNKDDIIAALLLDKKLMKENEKSNRLLANHKGVSKNVIYELLQIPVEERNSDKKIEDKLMDFGKVLKQKIAQEKIDKLKSQDMQYTFKPQIYTQKNSKYMNNINSNDFYKRAQKFEERKETHLEKIKTTIVDPEEGEYIFKPKITKKAQHIKRTVDDLFNWNKEKNKKINKKIQEKKEKENEEIETNQNLKHMDDYSKILVTKKSVQSKCINLGNSGKKKYRSSSMNNIKNNNDTDLIEEIQFDLWPEELNRQFYYKNEILNNKNFILNNNSENDNNEEEEKDKFL